MCRLERSTTLPGEGGQEEESSYLHFLSEAGSTIRRVAINRTVSILPRYDHRDVQHHHHAFEIITDAGESVVLEADLEATKQRYFFDGKRKRFNRRKHNC